MMEIIAQWAHFIGLEFNLRWIYKFNYIHQI